jgi:hypothetical protein
MVVCRRLGFVVAVGVFVAFQQTSASAQAADPLAGTWKLNLAKSTFDPPELAQKSITASYHVEGDTITASLEGVDYLGRTTRSEYTATFDGRDHPSRGTLDGKPVSTQDAISWKKIDDRTYEVLNKLNGRVLTTQRIVIAADGKTRTTTITGTNAQGQTVHNVLFFERQ